ncbi:MAG: proteobacterial dedicated sortase system histidine kinase, partial [Gammaproteobacteria bacterium]|nr:proteobacterial dedicated sortase system histidine kinase [Gammaproteobacteria bacterium]
GQPIIVNCRIVRDQAVIRIINAGPYLPQEMKDRIFESMVSVRPHQKQRQPHLGMGLHIARLITDFHNGQIRADNREDVEGVMITVSIPLFYR